MNRKAWFLIVCMVVIQQVTARAQTSVSEPDVSSRGGRTALLVVPERVAALVRPILDEENRLLSGQGGDGHKLSNLLYALTQEKGRTANEALVVLMCFYTGESQEETDAVIARGPEMLSYLRKYQHRNPEIPNRSYPESMRKRATDRTSDFSGAIDAIRHGKRGTWDNPGE